IHDFLPRFVGDELVGPSGAVYKEVAGKPPALNLSYYKPTNRTGRPFMPVEFSVAAYRFGHSLIRPFYVLNDTGVVDIFRAAGGRNLNRGPPLPESELPGREGAQDRHEAVDTAGPPPGIRRPAPRPDDPPGRAQQPPR